MKRPDPFLLLTAAGRRRREQADLDFLIHATAMAHAGTAEALAVSDRMAARHPDVHFPALRQITPDDLIEFAICVRVDLDHPIAFEDNLFTQCADCSCDLQYRPDTPAGDRVCICCAADRIRERGDG